MTVRRAMVDLYLGQEHRIDVSSEAGTRFDTDVTGFRADEEIGIDWRPAVFSGWVQRVTGI